MQNSRSVAKREKCELANTYYNCVPSSRETDTIGDRACVDEKVRKHLSPQPSGKRGIVVVVGFTNVILNSSFLSRRRDEINQVHHDQRTTPMLESWTRFLHEPVVRSRILVGREGERERDREIAGRCTTDKTKAGRVVLLRVSVSLCRAPLKFGRLS